VYRTLVDAQFISSTTDDGDAIDPSIDPDVVRTSDDLREKVYLQNIETRSIAQPEELAAELKYSNFKLFKRVTAPRRTINTRHYYGIKENMAGFRWDGAPLL
jgi:hypothetical protein